MRLVKHLVARLYKDGYQTNHPSITKLALLLTQTEADSSSRRKIRLISIIIQTNYETHNQGNQTFFVQVRPREIMCFCYVMSNNISTYPLNKKAGLEQFDFLGWTTTCFLVPPILLILNLNVSFLTILFSLLFTGYCGICISTGLDSKCHLTRKHPIQQTIGFRSLWTCDWCMCLETRSWNSSRWRLDRNWRKGRKHFTIPDDIRWNVYIVYWVWKLKKTNKYCLYYLLREQYT